MKLIALRKCRLVPRFWGILAASALHAGGATLGVSPATVPHLYPGSITLQITGLTNGESVLVERFLDPNGNGIIDPGEPMVQSFALSDGQVTSIGGVQNQAVPGDEDLTVNGQITARLLFQSGPEFSRGAGNQIFRLSSPTGRFSAVQQTFAVTEASLSQQISGTVSSGGSALPFAWAAVLMQVGTDTEFIGATTADAAGHFVLSVTNGTYEVIGFKPGYVGNFGTSPLVTISGANTNVSVPLSVANLSLSGKVSDASSAAGIAGCQFFATSGDNDYLAFFSDAQGNFSAPIISGQWKLQPSDGSALLGGYLRAQGKQSVTVNANVTGVSVTLSKATAMIYGQLKTAQNVPFGGVRIYGSDSGNLYQSTCYTDTNGNYFLPVLPATWNFGVDGPGAGLPASYVSQQVQLSLVAGQAVQTNLLATPVSAYLAGKAFNGNNQPISGGNMFAFGPNGQNVGVPIAGDGSFVVPAGGGMWTLELDTQTALAQNLVGPQLTLSVIDGVNISNIVYVAVTSTRTITGNIQTVTNTPVAGIFIYANAMVNGTNYNVSVTTDSAGNFSMPVLPASWSVSVDSQGLAQRGFPALPSQNVDTSAGNQTANFIVGGQPVGTIFFRQNFGVIGEFGPNLTPAVSYPVSAKNYRVMFHVFNDTNPPAVNTVFFTGPPGSGLTNSPADPAFGVVQDGTNLYYLSPAVRNPAVAQGGTWTVTYRNSQNLFSVPDPQVLSHMAIPVPTVTLTNGQIAAIRWTYTTSTGSLWPGLPSFITQARIDLFDPSSNPLDSEVVPPASTFVYPATNQFAWQNIGAVRMGYYDALTNQYFFNFTESAPTLTGTGTVAGGKYQFSMNGAPGQNYTIQFATSLANGQWNTLYVTNSLTSPIQIVDPTPTTATRFYRVLVGP